MFALDLLFSLLAQGDIDVAKSIWGGAGFLFGLGGAFFIASALWPQFKATHQHKNTIGVNVPMFIFHTVVAILFLVGSLYMVYAASGNPKEDCAFAILTGLVFTILNLYGFIGNFYIISLKFLHDSGAKKLGVTTSEYYEKHVFPKLKLNQEQK